MVHPLNANPKPLPGAITEHPEWMYREDWNIGNLAKGISAVENRKVKLFVVLLNFANKSSQLFPCQN
jgi:hypothetical protein